jgi:hypothetical protein
MVNKENKMRTLCGAILAAAMAAANEKRRGTDPAKSL